ncbi:MAG: proline--tRNA ligase [Spirochaetia bacterium]|nr:proline--tRNA ligase [Spirochaetia bacterium]
MRLTQYILPTLKESPAEATIPSHTLMIRSGMIRKMASGLYSYLPFGLRALRKVEAIVREEMNRAGALEFEFPILLTKELLQTAGRWERYKNENLLFNLKDRGGSELALGPTHEESFTQWVASEIKSHKQLPVNLYQIHTKFRDEIRPRFGVMRSKEFVMKDAYSFHLDDKSLDETYRLMSETYTRIFRRCGLDFVHVKADSGAMGGSDSEEFMVKSSVGEEGLLISEGYSANIETAQEDLAALVATNPNTPGGAIEKISTPNQKTIEELTAFLKVPASAFIKSLLYDVNESFPNGKVLKKTVMILIRGDLEVNEIKLGNHFTRNAKGVMEVRLSNEETVRRVTGAPVGFAGPVGLKETIDIFADVSLQGMEDGVTGANEEGQHYQHVSLSRDAKIAAFAEFYTAREGRPAPGGRHTLQLFRGVEVGHIFKLGKKYTLAFGAKVLDETSSSVVPTMGCYGIGVNRTLAAVIEQHHDEAGISWPMSVAPFHVLLLTMNAADEKVMAYSEALYRELSSAGIEVLWDDRDERPGFKFKDADLVGLPIQIVVGEKGIAQDQVEWKLRAEKEKSFVARKDVLEKVKTLVNAV